MLLYLIRTELYSFKHNANPALRTVAVRTFAGSCATLVSSVANLTVLAANHGEPGWICLMLCNLDILFSVLVLHWATSGDRQRGGTHSGQCQHSTHISRNMSHYGRNHEVKEIGNLNSVCTQIAAERVDEERGIATPGIHVKTVHMQELEIASDDQFAPRDSGSEKRIIL